MVAVLKSIGAPTRAEFHEVIASRADRWYAACLKITRDRDLAEDAVQDALLSAWNKRHQYERSARLDTWIHRIAVNAALGIIRKSKPGVFQPLETEVEDIGVTPDRAWEDYELESDLAKALSSLTEIERVCFVLKHLEQWRAGEIGAELGIVEGRVKQAVFRAVKKLRVSMQDMQRETYE